MKAPVIDSLPVDQYQESLMTYCKDYWLAYKLDTFNEVVYEQSARVEMAKNYCSTLISSLRR